eukprot:TRINITY_DN8651_c0_g1_i7.p1 TRINITY_DN8651_c0_g1~~TRINITY_DN8651_c0_g1_i7.p1  ORF type:complete len:188 (-),score=37.88 TRINITY_DN8651_c0_g1_i7:143-706(-)
MVQNSDFFSSKICLELGSGIGLTGVVLCKKVNVKLLVMTDYTDAVLSNLQRNVEINQVPSDIVRVMELDWEKLDQFVLKQPQSPEILFAADCVYDPGLIDSFVPVLKHFLKQEVMHGSEGVRTKPVAYIATTIRNPTTFQYFLKTLESHGIQHSFVSRDICPNNSSYEFRWNYSREGIVISVLRDGS